tara:strand:+ start:1109 stop:1354 length:246 start_codon:yes stop_codon:yes gene_type:complete
MGYFKTEGGVGSPFTQKQSYEYKHNGKNITKERYCEIQSANNESGNETKGGGLQTTDPDACGIKARINEERKKNFPDKKPK